MGGIHIRNQQQAYVLLRARLPADAEITPGETSSIKGSWVFSVVMTVDQRILGYVYYVNHNGDVWTEEGNTLAWDKMERVRPLLAEGVGIRYQHTAPGGLDVFYLSAGSLSCYIVIDDFHIVSTDEGFEAILATLMR